VLHVEINPADASARRILDGAPVSVRSRRGTITAIAFVTTVVQQGQVFMPMHFRDVNKLTFPAYDPHSRQPSYKACAVTVAPLPK
jgi:assimilatory nitrate reductase catalytic subunit